MLAKMHNHKNTRQFVSNQQTFSPARAHQLTAWLNDILSARPLTYGAPIADASLRRYLRVETDENRYIVMDAPDQRRTLRDFVQIAERLRRCGVNVPIVHGENQVHGFLLLSDLGEQTYLDRLDHSNADTLYGAAMDSLIQIQTLVDATGLADYDDATLRVEMEMFIEWFLNRHLSVELGSLERKIFAEGFAVLLSSASQQPRCFVHRDYHSRNLMISCAGGPGVLDFQDAVRGPLTYDLVSVLKDVYVMWPAEKVTQWVSYYYESAARAGLLKDVDRQQFLQWFDLMGVQRHLKIAGIFSRLYYRDGKPAYLKDIPYALRYLHTVTAKYQELNRLHQLLRDLEVEKRTAIRAGEIVV